MRLRPRVCASATRVAAACAPRFFSSAAAASTSSDPYKLMGLQRNASAAEVKTRYRELAKQNHPDLNSNDPSCAAKMAKITDAYSLLMDPRKRRQYDEAQFSSGNGAAYHGGSTSSSSGGANSNFSSAAHDPDRDWVDPSQMYSEFSNIFGKMAGRATRGSRAGPAQQRGDDASVDLKVSFLEAMRGSRRRVGLKLQLPCNDCGSSGAQAGSGWTKCTLCNGTGVRRVERGIMSMGLPCARCGGVGEILEHACRTCKGDGVVGRRTEIEVDVPPGIKPGMELRLPGQGHAGLRGGPRGHLFVVVNVEPHSVFRHIDDDLHADVGLSLKTMLLGGSVKVPTLEGEVAIELPPLSDPSTTRILRGRGPTRLSGDGRGGAQGNLVLHFALRLPEALTAEQRNLICAFDEIERTGTKRNGGSRRQEKESCDEEKNKKGG